MGTNEDGILNCQRVCVDDGDRILRWNCGIHKRLRRTHDECRGRKPVFRSDIPQEPVGIMCHEGTTEAADEAKNEPSWKTKHNLLLFD